MPGPVLAGQRLLPSQIATTIANLATGSVNNSIAETVIGTLLVPGGAASNQGYSFSIEGTNDNQASASSVTFRLRYGPTGTTSDHQLVVYNAVSTQASAQTGLPWDIAGRWRVITSGSSGNAYLNCTLTSAIASSTTAAQPGAVQPAFFSPINWTIPNFLSVTVAWGAASVSNITRTIGGSVAAVN